MPAALRRSSMRISTRAAGSATGSERSVTAFKQAEDRRVGADAERERGDCDRADAGIPPQRTESVFHVLPDGPESGAAAAARHGWLGIGRALRTRERPRQHFVGVERFAGRRFGLGFRHAARPQFAIPVVEIVGQLVQDFFLALRVQLQRRQAPTKFRSPLRHVRLRQCD